MVKQADLPFESEIKYVTRNDLTPEHLQECLEEAEANDSDGISICVKVEGDVDSGGYLFHYTEHNNQIEIRYFPFNEEDCASFASWERLHRFILHAIGEEWDEEMYRKSLRITARTEG